MTSKKILEDNVQKDRIETYLTIHKLSSMKRSGWVYYGIEQPETIMSHMYDAWLLGTLFLPTESHLKQYDKDRILQMLLIHDLGESITGDIMTPLKDQDPKYDAMEEDAMKIIMSAFPEKEVFFDLWSEWSAHESINSKIARDLDILQSIIQFCLYRQNDSQLEKESVTGNWLKKRSRLSTDTVRNIYDVIIPMIIDNRLLPKDT